MAKGTIAAPEMPELFRIEETNPLFAGGNVYDAATEMARYAQFLQNHFDLDEDDHDVRTAMYVLLDALQKHRDTLASYHQAFVAWKEAQAKGGAA